MKSTLTHKLRALAASAAAVWLLAGASAVLAEGDAAEKEKVLARVDGQAITEAEILQRAAGDLLKLDQQRHQLINTAVRGRIQELLTENEAKRRGMTTEELYKAEVEAKTGEVSASDVDAFYAARRGQIRQPKEQVEMQIRQVLAFQKLIDTLDAKAEVEMLMEPYRIAVNLDGPSKGKADAAVTIVEFGDFQCPPCGKAYPVLKQVREAYPDDVRFVFQQFPLAIHPEARKAAEASLCARDQDKFWEMHDQMFENQQSLAVDGLKTLASKIEGLDAAAFNACLDDGRHAAAVEEDFQEGSRLGVNGTPAFFVNGRVISGAPSFEALAEMIDEELARRKGASDAAGR